MTKAGNEEGFHLVSLVHFYISHNYIFCNTLVRKSLIYLPKTLQHRAALNKEEENNFIFT